MASNVTEETVRALVDRFVRRMAEDFVIGFRFEGKDLDRIIHHETSLAMTHLGTGKYTGRSLPEVHLPMRISRGQFQRRLALLRTVLREAGMPEPFIAAWIAHDERFEAAIATPVDCTP